MAEDVRQSVMDSEDHEKTYNSVMRASGEFGVPFALALTMFFTNLVLANGVGFSIVAAVVTYIAVFFFVKLFFSH